MNGSFSVRYGMVFPIVVVLAWPGYALSEVRINEVAASNGSVLADEDGDFEDWVELYNTGGDPVNLEGWGLSDREDEPFLWTFPEVWIQPGEYLVVWASGKDRKPGESGEDDPEEGDPAAPDEIDGLVGWFDAGAAGAFEDGDPMGQWSDASGHGNHAFQNLGTKRPTFRAAALNGRPAVSFNRSAGQVFSLPNAAFSGMDNLEDFTLLTVARWDGGTTSGLFGTGPSNNNASNVHLEIPSTGQLRFRVGNMNDIRVNGAVQSGGWALIGATQHTNTDDPAGRLYLDGERIGFRPGGSGRVDLDEFGGVFLGSSWDSERYFNGLIAEFLLYNRVLSDQEREGVERYLREKYQLGGGLPGANGPQLHTNFRIASDGERIALTRPDGTAADVLPATPMRRDMSVGRYPDGHGDWRIFPEPTPWTSNSTATPFDAVLEPPVFSHGRGWYEEPFELELHASNEGATIYYTLNGSHPGPENGIPYDGEPIPIDGTSHIRAIEHRDGSLASLSASHTYLFLDQVLQQPNDPEGWPSVWGAGDGEQPQIAANYGMHPDIVNDPDYGGMLRAGFRELPVMSLTMDPEHVFGEEEGLYTYPNRSGREAERPVSVEFFTPDGDEQFQIDAGVRVQGGSSTAGWKVLKLSMRLFFRGDYGETRLEHPFFPDSEVTSFRTLVLGAGHNLTWQHPDHSQRRQGQFVRDVFMPDLHREMGALSPHDRYAHVFINGLYWGKYYVQNRPDATFMADNLGGSRDDYDVMRHRDSSVVDGNSEAWSVMRTLAGRDLSVLENYEALGEHLDIPGFIDYMLFNFWAGNTDWSHHNWYAGRKREDDAKWQFFSWDAEHVLKSVNQSAPGGNTNGAPHRIFNSLRDSEEFRLLFADHVHRHFSKGGVFYTDPENPEWDPRHPGRNPAAHLYMKRIAEIDNSMALETARWGNTRPHPERDMYTRNEDWIDELNRLLNNYFPQRSGFVFNGLRNAGLYPSMEAPVLDPRGGTVSGSLTVSMSHSLEGVIYYTLNGEDPRVYGTGEISEHAVAYDGESGGVEIAGGIVVKARVFNRGAWSALTEAVFAEPRLEPHDLSAGSYVFDYGDPDAPAGTYPASMIFEQSHKGDPALPAEMDGYWNLPYNLTSRSRVVGLGEYGISFINTANAQDVEGAGYVGSAVLALDTRGQEDVHVQWTAGTVVPNERAYGMRLQYRVGAAGKFRDVTDANLFPLEYRSGAAAGHARAFGPVRLPGELEDEPYVELRWKYYYLHGKSGPRAELRLDNILVASGEPGQAAGLAFETRPPNPGQSRRSLPPVIVHAIDNAGMIDRSFAGEVALSLSEDGVLEGAAAVVAREGVAVFEGLSIGSGGTFTLTASAAGQVSAETEPFQTVLLAEEVMPRYMQGDGGENNDRVPFAFRLKLEGLAPHTTYRYGNRVVVPGDSPDQNGAGNAILVTGAQTDWIRNTDSPRFRAGDRGSRHLDFTTDADGSYAGWFVTEPTGNARFTPGNTVFIRLLLNDGSGGDAYHHFLTAESAIEVIAFGDGSGEGSALMGQADSSGRSFVVLYDNVTGDERPLSAVPVEITGSGTDERYAAFYHETVAASEGFWGTILPNALEKGLRRVEERALADGGVLRVRRSTEGFAGTVNPDHGLSPLFLEDGDGGLLTRYSAWREAVFVDPDDRGSDEISGPEADPLGQGVSNLLRYAFGIGLSEDPGARLPRLAADSDGMRLAFPFRSEREDIAYIVESSEDLDAWDRTLFDSRNGSAGTGDLVEIDLGKPDPGSPKRFYRVRILLDE